MDSSLRSRGLRVADPERISDLMPKTPGPQSGPKPKTPQRGMNGPTDKGRSGGTKHYGHPNVVSKTNPNITGAGGAGMTPSKKYCK